MICQDSNNNTSRSPVTEGRWKDVRQVPGLMLRINTLTTPALRFRGLIYRLKIYNFTVWIWLMQACEDWFWCFFGNKAANNQYFVPGFRLIELLAVLQKHCFNKIQICHWKQTLQAELTSLLTLAVQCYLKLWDWFLFYFYIHDFTCNLFF